MRFIVAIIILMQIYLPFISNNSKAMGLSELIISSPEQQRTTLLEHSILKKAAEWKAKDMSLRGYFSHTTPEGLGPNKLVESFGYNLPSWYDDDLTANNIESMFAGYENAEDVINAINNSPLHKNHIFGITDFYVQQTRYGIGYAYNPESKYHYYWVVIIAHEEQGDEI